MNEQNNDEIRRVRWRAQELIKWPSKKTEKTKVG